MLNGDVKCFQPFNDYLAHNDLPFYVFRLSLSTIKFGLGLAKVMRMSSLYSKKRWKKPVFK